MYTQTIFNSLVWGKSCVIIKYKGSIFSNLMNNITTKAKNKRTRINTYIYSAVHLVVVVVATKMSMVLLLITDLLL